ncbi:MAG: FtsX-like permease family protein [Desulfobulbaceae bacterium]|nr:FtsX-like permease family protein [Desulfobulbaceae bacterium]
MNSLNRKLLRELLRLRGQMLAVAAVVTCGIAVFSSMSSGRYSLIESKDKYYNEYRFADVFLQVKRAPEALQETVKNIPGVADVRTRIITDVTLDVPGVNEPATGRLVSIPERRTTVLNDIFLRSGRYIDPERPEEIVVSEPFVQANHLQLGDTLGAIINGRWKSLRIIGVGLSPEYVYEVQPGAFFPDNKRFGILWMSHKALAGALNMTGAFNDLSLTLAHGTSVKDIVMRLDNIFARYGSLGAYGRDEHLSNRFITDEIKQVGTQVTVVPTIFLAVAIFLLNIVLRRLVTTQRDQIAVLKALGYTNRDVGLHYLTFALVPVAVGAIVGTGLGAWLGSELLDIYPEYYHFPKLIYYFRVKDVAVSVLLSVAAACVGALSAVRDAVNLPAAEAMRPDAPVVYRLGILDRFGFLQRLSVSIRIIIRNLERRPWKSALSALMIAFAVAILIAGRYSYDAVKYLTLIEFSMKHKEDVTVIFNEPRPPSIKYEIARLDGVLEQEFYRDEPARLRFGHRVKRLSLTGVESPGRLRRIVDANMKEYPLPPEGLVLTTTLADILGIKRGDTLTVEFLQGERRTENVVVAGLIDEMLGLSAYMNIKALDRLAGDGGAVTAAYLRLDSAKAKSVYSDFKHMPKVSGAMMLKAMRESYDKVLAESMLTTTTILTLFACTIAFAVVYNGARISLSERGRELASLRVLGFTNIEVSIILLGEQAILTLVAIPIGFVIGVGLSVLLAKSLNSDLYRMPLIFSGENFAFAFIVMVFVAVASGLIIRQRIYRLDLIAVLKTKE